jgi:hypothetical protein
MKINVTPEEFQDVVVAFLLDKLLHPNEIVPNNEGFNKLAKIMSGKGLKSRFMMYYLDMDTRNRVQYKRIKDIFDGTTSGSAVINISPSKKKEKDKDTKGIMMKIIKKLLKKESITVDEENILLESFKKEEE